MMLLLVALLTGPGAELPDRASALYPVLEEAYQHFESKAYPEAVRAFERAFAISPEPRFVLNIAVTQRRAEQCTLSLAAFERFFEVCDGCAQQSAAEPLAREADTWCRPAIRIETDPPGAQVQVDGKPHGASPVDLKLAIGGHVLRVTAPGYLPEERPLMVQGGASAQVRFDLTAVAAPVLPPPESSNAWLWGSAAIGGAGLVTGGVFGLLLLNDLDDERSAQTRSALESARTAAKRDAVLAQVGLGLALTGAASALIIWATDDGDERALRLGPNGIVGCF